MQTTALSIFDYLEYREFLRDFYLEQKRKQYGFSLRYLSQRTKIDPAHLVRVFQCKRHFSEDSLAAFVSLCKLNADEKKYFDRLFLFNTARTDRQASQAFESLLKLANPRSLELRPEQYQFYTKWYYTAVRALIALRPFSTRDCSKIAKMLSPPITVSQAKEAAGLLLALGLVRKDEAGILRVTDTHITTGAKWQSLAVKAFQTETLRLAQESLDRHAKDLRDISTVTIGIKRNRMDEFRERIAEFRKSIIHLAEEEQDPDEVCQFNIQLFPLTDTSKDGRPQ